MAKQPMRGFPGFPSGRGGNVPVPKLFFSELLPQIDDLAELKLTIYAFWALQQREGAHRYLRLRDLLTDEVLLTGLASKPDAAEKALRHALECATARGTLLHVVLSSTSGDEHLYFMNTPRGRSAVAALEQGDWMPGTVDQPIGLIAQRPNIFALYEQNIGPLTPMLSEILRDAENTYPADWITDAVKIAVELNKRSWRYVEAVLKRWASEGRQAPARADAPADEHPYLKDEYFQRRGAWTDPDKPEGDES